jgi:hypothetical protein
MLKVNNKLPINSKGNVLNPRNSGDTTEFSRNVEKPTNAKYHNLVCSINSVERNSAKGRITETYS